MPKYPVDDPEKGEEESTEINASEEEAKPEAEQEKPAEEKIEEDSTDWKEEARKAKEVAENYRKENEKYRGKKDRIAFDDSAKGLPTEVRRDFHSKKEDILDEMKEEINKLDDGEWSAMEPLIKPALDGVLGKAESQKRFVAKGEIKRALDNLLQYAKKSATRDQEIEQARAEGATEAAKMESAEISGVKSRPSQSGVSEEARALAKEKGWSPDVAKEILEKRKEREREYAVRGKY